MKLTIGKKQPIASSTPTPASKAKKAPPVVAKSNRKRSPKELALLWFNNEMNGLVQKMNSEDLEMFSADVKVNQTTMTKAREFLAGRVDRVLMPVHKLLEKRGLL